VREIKESVFIVRPIEAVFAYMSDYDNETEWWSNVIEAYLTSEGPMGLGTTGREVRKLNGVRFVSDWVITEFEAPNRVVFESTSGPFPYIGRVHLEEQGSGTKLTYIFEFFPVGLYRLLIPLTEWLFVREFRADLTNLKRILKTDDASH
jgi:uncharacterized protein YndB with AHSA1/START domain